MFHGTVLKIVINWNKCYSYKNQGSERSIITASIIYMMLLVPQPLYILTLVTHAVTFWVDGADHYHLYYAEEPEVPSQSQFRHIHRVRLEKVSLSVCLSFDSEMGTLELIMLLFGDHKR